MQRRLACMCLLAGLLALWQTHALASQLTDIQLDEQPYYLDLHLSFDNAPVLTDIAGQGTRQCDLAFGKCTLAVPQQRLGDLAALQSTWLSRLTTDSQPEALTLRLGLRSPARPFLRSDEHGYVLRFYRQDKRGAYQLGPGVSLAILGSGAVPPKAAAYVVRLEPGAGAQVQTTAADRYDGKTHLRLPSSFARRAAADVVVNGGYFGPAGQHVTTFIEDGYVRATGVYPTRPMLLFDDAGRWQIGRYLAQSALLVDDGQGGAPKRIPLSGKNYPFVSGRVIAYEDPYPRETLPKSGVYYYLLCGGCLSFAGSDPAAPQLPPGTLLIATDLIPEANPLQHLPADAKVALETKVLDSAGAEVHARSAVGGGPLLVQDGAVHVTVDEDKIKPDIARGARSRTAAAITSDGALLLVVIKEDAANGYPGLTLDQLAQMLVAQGAQTALNLDGGSSSALLVAGELLNKQRALERPVANVLIVKTVSQTGQPAASSVKEQEDGALPPAPLGGLTQP